MKSLWYRAFVFGIDLTPYYLGSSLLHGLSPLERFMSYRCPREALFAYSGPVLPETRPQHRGRVGKRKGRKGGLRAQSRSVCGTSAGDHS